VQQVMMFNEVVPALLTIYFNTRRKAESYLEKREMFIFANEETLFNRDFLAFSHFLLLIKKHHFFAEMDARRNKVFRTIARTVLKNG
jgi:hypothetical protein